MRGRRKSWLSREIIAFNGLAGLATGVVAAAFVPVLTPFAPLLLWGATAAGAVAVFTSIMVYVDTRRPFWSLAITGGKFAGTALLLGAATAAALWTGSGHPAAQAATLAAWGLRLALSAWEQWKLRAALSDSSSTWHRSALVMARLQTDWNGDRFLLLLLSGGLLPVSALLLPAMAAPLLTLSLLAILASQLIERRQFFTAAAGPNMPGCRPAE